MASPDNQDGACVFPPPGCLGMGKGSFGKAVRGSGETRHDRLGREKIVISGTDGVVWRHSGPSRSIGLIGKCIKRKLCGPWNVLKGRFARRGTYKKDVPSLRKDDSKAKHLDDFKSVYSAESEAEAKARLGLFVAKWSQTYPSFRKYLTEPGGAVLVLPLPQGSLEAPLHLKRGRGLARLPQKEAEGQAGPPFPQERVLPHSRRGREMQQIRQEQEADRLR